MHGQRDQYPNEHRGSPQHHQILRHAQNLQQLLLHLRVLQRRNSRRTPIQTGQTLRTEGPPHLQTTTRSIPGPQQVQHHAP